MLVVSFFVIIMVIGGVGILATGPLSANETRDSIRRIRDLTDQPFGIGATLLMPGAAENAKVALEEHVPLINVSLGKAEWIAQAAHEYGAKVLATVTTAKHAAAALEAGADALMLTGHEAAAHGGDVTSLVLIPSIRQRFPDVPLVAAGGFANGQGVAAALALGADAVAMGSRLAVTLESPLADAVKNTIAYGEHSTESDTVYGHKFDGIPARVWKSPTSTQLMNKSPIWPVVLVRAIEAARQMKLPIWKVVAGLVTQWDKIYAVAQFGAATHALQTATIHGNLQDGVQFIGQSQGLIHDIPAVGDLIQRIIEEAKQVAMQNATLYEDSKEDFTETTSIVK